MSGPTSQPLIIGAGIQGATLALAAVARGQRPILIEQGGAAAGASVNSYGVVHGGLRYLQSLDVARWRQSRRAQAWYLRHYPHHVRPLRCVMPLYRGGLRSPLLFAVARGIDRALRLLCRQPVALPDDGACSRDAILDEFAVVPGRLMGGAVWYDAEVSDPAALLNEMLCTVERRGGTILRSTQAVALASEGGQVRGLHVRDVGDGREEYLAGGAVFDCRGAWASAPLDDTSVGARERQRPTAAMLAFNLLLDIAPPKGSAAYALSPIAGRGRSYFFRGWQGGTLVGTFYRAAPGMRVAEPSKDDIIFALHQVRRCLPGVEVDPAMVRAVQAGLLPDKDGSGRVLDMRDRHLRPGPAGYHMLIGGKLTTAPLLTERVADALWSTGPLGPVGDAEPVNDLRVLHA